MPDSKLSVCTVRTRGGSSFFLNRSRTCIICSIVLYIYLIESSISTYWYGSTQLSTLKAIGHGRARSFRYTSKQPSIDHSATINLNPKLEGPNKECTKHPPTLGQSLGSFEIDSLELS